MVQPWHMTGQAYGRGQSNKAQGEETGHCREECGFAFQETQSLLVTPKASFPSSYTKERRPSFPHLAHHHLYLLSLSPCTQVSERYQGQPQHLWVCLLPMATTMQFPQTTYCPTRHPLPLYTNTHTQHTMPPNRHRTSPGTQPHPFPCAYDHHAATHL